MPNTYTRLHIQAIFAVKFRKALIDKKWKAKLNMILGNHINETGCKTLIVNGVEDHVHCLFELKSTVQLSELMKKVKAKSSKFINDHHLTDDRFEWQRGYSAFSYAQCQIKEVYDYVAKQEMHHCKTDFQTEHRSMLIENQIPFDESYYFENLI
jgi:REP element-mobilizing transposase RayT